MNGGTMASNSAGGGGLVLLVILLSAVYHGPDHLGRGGQLGSNAIGSTDVIMELKGMVEEGAHNVKHLTLLIGPIKEDYNTPGPRSSGSNNINIFKRVGSQRHDLGLEGCGDGAAVFMKAGAVKTLQPSTWVAARLRSNRLVIIPRHEA
jgi:hypothetical protein